MQHCGYRMLCVDLLLVDSRIKGEKVHHVLIEVHAYYILCGEGRIGKSGGTMRNYELGPSIVAAAYECPVKSER